MVTAEQQNERTGRCLCGAVRFVAHDVPLRVGICHCAMCRRWTGSALVEVSVDEANVTWHGEAHITTRQTSDFAERAWCQKCGSGLYFRMTEDNAFSGSYALPLGLFDDPDGFTLTHEIFIDHKPDSFAFQGDHVRLDRDACVEKFPKLTEAGAADPAEGE